MKNIMLAGLLLLICSSCSKNLSTTINSGAIWTLTEWPGKTLPPSGRATLSIGEGNRVGGKSFCNTYGGTATINGNAIQFSQLMGTKMYCADFAAAEDNYLSDLQKVNAGRIAAGKLYLLKDEQVLLIFRKQQ